MNENIHDTKRLAKNTLMLYIRMLFTLLVSLYTTRVILNTLGASDYGIYDLVGGVVGLMNIVTSLLSQGTTRFITIALGKNDLKELQDTFSASMTIHAILALVIFVAGEAVGPWFIGKLNISPERMGAAQFVFQMSLISSVIGITQSPFHAAIVAHERMNVYAYISIWDVVAKLLIVYLLTAVNLDKLKLYSALYFIVGLITVLMYLFYCRRNFPECRSFILKPDRKLYKAIFNYTGWNAIGSLAFTLNGQGITVLLSSFGTVVNAARGIAGSVSGVVYKFVDSFQTAARPQIVKLCAVQDYPTMNSLILRVSKFSSYLVGLIGVPLFLEMEYVLQLWLKEVPDYTVIFARLTLIQGLIQAIDLPIGAGIHAVGKMKLPNITSAIIYMMILPVSYIAIIMGATPEITYVVIICVYPMALLMDLYILNKYTEFPVGQFLIKVVCLSLMFIVGTAFVTNLVSCLRYTVGFGRLITTVLMSSLTFIPLVFIFGLTKSERQFVKNFISEKMKIIHG